MHVHSPASFLSNWLKRVIILSTLTRFLPVGDQNKSRCVGAEERGKWSSRYSFSLPQYPPQNHLSGPILALHHWSHIWILSKFLMTLETHKQLQLTVTPNSHSSPSTSPFAFTLHFSSSLQSWRPLLSWHKQIADLTERKSD